MFFLWRACDVGNNRQRIPNPPNPSLLPQNQYYNDVWAFDFDSYFRSNKTCNTGAACWLQITPNDAPGMFAKRNSFSLDVYGSGVILFGGFWHDIAAGGSFSGCSPTVKCIW